MVHLILKCQRSKLLFALANFVFISCSSGLSADEVADKNQKQTRAQRVSDSDIEWDSLGFHGGRRLIGDNAIQVYRGNVEQSTDLIRKLDDEKSFVAAHVLLTALWRVPQRKKNTFSHPLSDGFFVCHNGLFVQIKWEDADGKEKKVAIISDLECQRKRIREFWTLRIKQHPEEFLSETIIDE